MTISIKGTVTNLDKLLKATLVVDGGTPTLNVSLGGVSKSTPLTEGEWKQFSFIVGRSGLLTLEDADDIIGDAPKLTETIAEQAKVLDGLRNQLSAAQGQVEQFKGANTMLETKASELEKALSGAKDTIAASTGADATIAELRSVISGLQTKVDDLTAKLASATIIEDGGVATATVQDATPPVSDAGTNETPPPQQEEVKT